MAYIRLSYSDGVFTPHKVEEKDVPCNPADPHVHYIPDQVFRAYHAWKDQGYVFDALFVRLDNEAHEEARGSLT